MGHKQNDDVCLAIIPRDMMKHIIPFRGGCHQFSNLHKCPEGCTLKDGELSFDTSEQMYQYSRLEHHGMHEVMRDVLTADSGFEAMTKAHEAPLKEDSSNEWIEEAIPVMMKCVWAKLEGCPHVRETLIELSGRLVEATSDTFWGSGVSVEMTRSTLPDYWPRKNRMGEILSKLWFEFCLLTDAPDISDAQIKEICAAQAESEYEESDMEDGEATTQSSK